MQKVYDPDAPRRCENCYRLRLGRTARRAREQGCGAFTTTLLGSPHQRHDLIRRVGEEEAEAAGMHLLYRDFRPLHDRSIQLAKRRTLYRQQYCGCCWSEYERYKDTTKELYRGPGGPP